MIQVEDILLIKSYGKYKPVYNIILKEDFSNIENIISSYLNNHLSIVYALGNLYIIKNDEFICKYGLCDKEGNIIIMPIYNYIDNHINNNLIMVVKDGMFGYINKEGKEVIPCTKTYSSFSKEEKEEINIYPLYKDTIKIDNFIFKNTSMINKCYDDINKYYQDNNLYNAYDFINHKFIYLKDYKIGLKITLSDNTYIIDKNTNTKENTFIKVKKIK